MGFGDLKSPAGLQVLNDYLADKSYIEGYVPSQADVAVFEAVSGPPPADLCHAHRWYNHIKSYEKERASLPGVKKALGKYGPTNVEDTTESRATDSKDDDDIDLFGSDDEEVWHKLTYVCIIVLKHRLYSQNPWVLTLASIKITCLLKFLTSYMMNKIKSPSFGWARDGFAFIWQS